MLVGLKYAEKPFRLIVFAKGPQRGGYLGGVVGVVVDHVYAVETALKHQTPPSAFELTKSCGYFPALQIRVMQQCRSSQRVICIVTARNRQRKPAEMPAVEQHVHAEAALLDGFIGASPETLLSEAEGLHFAGGLRRCAYRVVVVAVYYQHALVSYQRRKRTERFNNGLEVVVAVEVIFFHV